MGLKESIDIFSIIGGLGLEEARKADAGWHRAGTVMLEQKGLDQLVVEPPPERVSLVKPEKAVDVPNREQLLGMALSYFSQSFDEIT